MDFFRINLPYGISKNEDGEWMAFNREYLPLGYSKQPDTGQCHVLQRQSIGLPVYSKYYGLTDKFLLSLAASETSIQRDKEDKICVVWFYNDATNPSHRHSGVSIDGLYEVYWKKLQKLSEKCIKGSQDRL